MNSRIDNIKKEGTVEVKEYFYFLILLLWDRERGPDIWEGERPRGYF